MVRMRQGNGCSLTHGNIKLLDNFHLFYILFDYVLELDS